MPGMAVSASRNSNCEALVSAMMRGRPGSYTTCANEVAACSAAARAKEFLSSQVLMTIGEPQHSRQCSTHDHLPRVRRNIARLEQRFILLHNSLDALQAVVRSEDDFDKRACV